MHVEYFVPWLIICGLIFVNTTLPVICLTWKMTYEMNVFLPLVLVTAIILYHRSYFHDSLYSPVSVKAHCPVD